MKSIRLATPLLGPLMFAVISPTPARGDETDTPAFGAEGTVALQLNESLSVTSGDILAGPQVEASYFISPHVSLGLMLGANWYANVIPNAVAAHDVVVRVGPRVGYDIPLSDHLSFWPQLGFDYRADHQSTPLATTTGSSSSSTASALAIVAMAPLTLHPTPGFFIGAGPSFYTEFADTTSNGSAGKVTSIGLMATIGGAF